MLGHTGSQPPPAPWQPPIRLHRERREDLKHLKAKLRKLEDKGAKDGAKAGQRVVNGWKNANLPWTYKLDKAKMYFPK